MKRTYSTAMFELHSMCEAQVDFGDVTVLTKSGVEEIWYELVLDITARESRRLQEALLKLDALGERQN